MARNLGEAILGGFAKGLNFMGDNLLGYQARMQAEQRQNMLDSQRRSDIEFNQNLATQQNERQKTTFNMDMQDRYNNKMFGGILGLSKPIPEYSGYAMKQNDLKNELTQANIDYIRAGIEAGGGKGKSTKEPKLLDMVGAFDSRMSKAQGNIDQTMIKFNTSQQGVTDPLGYNGPKKADALTEWSLFEPYAAGLGYNTDSLKAISAIKYPELQQQDSGKNRKLSKEEESMIRDNFAHYEKMTYKDKIKALEMLKVENGF